MLLDDVGVCDLGLDAFVVADITDADGIPLNTEGDSVRNTVLNSQSTQHTGN